MRAGMGAISPLRRGCPDPTPSALFVGQPCCSECGDVAASMDFYGLPLPSSDSTSNILGQLKFRAVFYGSFQKEQLHFCEPAMWHWSL